MKLLFILGTRPEAIKLAPLIREFLKEKEFFQVQVCSTGQHGEMLDQVLSTFDLIVDYDLKIMSPHQDLFDVTSSIIISLRDVLNESKPDVVFVHGDTNTTFSTALAAFYSKIKIAHVEAGLRTGDLDNPWPEEANRQLCSRLATLHFAPTAQAKINLNNEGIFDNIFITGNTVIDALLYIQEKFRTTPNLHSQAVSSLLHAGFIPAKNRDYILVTAHRRENFGQGILEICDSIKLLSIKFPDIEIVYPVHLNPNVREPVQNKLAAFQNVFLLPPLDYLSFVFLMKGCRLIITDSGGLQEEAPALGKLVLLMRNSTERPEAVAAGTVRLVGTDKMRILKEVKSILKSEIDSDFIARQNPYGNGDSSRKIVDILRKKYEK